MNIDRYRDDNLGLILQEIGMRNYNEVQRDFKLLKVYIKVQNKFENDMEIIQKELDTMDWNQENRINRIRLYMQLGELMGKWRLYRMNVEYYREKLLKNANLTA